MEDDEGFRSGPWVGYYTYSRYPRQGFQPTELKMHFENGRISGDGADKVGRFVIAGRYHVEDRQCSWTKTYVGQHTLSYQGVQTGKTIQGRWEVDPTWHGAFAIWPEGEAGLTGEFFVKAEEPLTVEAPRLDLVTPGGRS